MHIGLDISSIVYGRGVSRYTTNLVMALQSLPQTKLSLYGASFRQYRILQDMAQKLARSQDKVVIQRLPPSMQNLYWNVLGVNKLKPQLPGIQVFHSWDWVQPPDKNLPIVSTIHDLAILKYPETAHPQILKMHRAAWKRLKQQQAHIIAVSRATKKDIVEQLEIDPALVHVVYEALPLEFKRVSDSLSEEQHDSIKNQLQLTKPFVLFVGTREPRKNLSRLIQAWEPLRKEVDLVIAGESGWDGTSKAKYQIPQLRFLGRVTDQQLAVLYAEAEVFAYPCLYEGFGLPILEAFHHGTPVLTSNTSSMVEVAGNAATLISPESTTEIRGGLEAILNESLDEQKRRLQRMIIRMQMFRWSQVAEQTLAVYQQAINR